MAFAVRRGLVGFWNGRAEFGGLAGTSDRRRQDKSASAVEDQVIDMTCLSPRMAVGRGHIARIRPTITTALNAQPASAAGRRPR